MGASMYGIPVESGVRLAVQDLNPGGKHVLLLVHGWPLSQKIFEYQTNVLPGHGVRCVSYDLRGYGDSDKPWHGYSYDRMADDLHKILRSLNCKPVTLLGFSMGGAVVTRYMARYKGFRVKKLILCGAAVPGFVQSPGDPGGMSGEAVNELIEQARNDRPAMVDSFGRLCFATDISDPYRRYFSDIGCRASGHATIKGLEYLRDEVLLEDMKKIRVPTMILHGKKDRVCPFPFAEQMRQGIEGSFIIPFENSGHCLFYDEKHKFTDMIHRFVTLSEGAV